MGRQSVSDLLTFFVWEHEQNLTHTVDGRKLANQLRLVVYLITYKNFFTSQVVQDFSYQQCFFWNGLQKEPLTTSFLHAPSSCHTSIANKSRVKNRLKSEQKNPGLLCYPWNRGEKTTTRKFWCFISRVQWCFFFFSVSYWVFRVVWDFSIFSLRFRNKTQPSCQFSPLQSDALAESEFEHLCAACRGPDCRSWRCNNWLKK